MKLADALLLRGDIQKKLASLRERVNSNVILDFYCKSSDHIESHLSSFVGEKCQLGADLSVWKSPVGR